MLLIESILGIMFLLALVLLVAVVLDIGAWIEEGWEVRTGRVVNPTFVAVVRLAAGLLLGLALLAVLVWGR